MGSAKNGIRINYYNYKHPWPGDKTAITRPDFGLANPWPNVTSWEIVVLWSKVCDRNSANSYLGVGSLTSV